MAVDGSLLQGELYENAESSTLDLAEMLDGLLRALAEEQALANHKSGQGE